jgi:acyl-CoA synthetase (AMP-forming)/AMP-acid ligase II
MPDRRMTFAQAERGSRRLGRRLLRAGVGKGTRVGIFDTYSTEWVVAWLAVTRIGALAMPFSSIYKPAELAKVMRIGDVHLLLATPNLLGRSTTKTLEDAIPGLAGAGAGPLQLRSHPFLRHIWMWGPTEGSWARQVELDWNGDDEGLMPDEVFDEVSTEVTPSDWAQVTYTSGSSALPKGVVHSHGAIVRTTASPQTVLAGGPAPASDDPDDPASSFCAFPFFWIGGTLVIGRALRSGKTICCLPKFEPGAALDMIERERCTSTSGWPSLIQAMRGHPSFPDRDLSYIPMLQPGAPLGIPPGPVPGVPGHRSMSELVGNWAGAERRVVDPDTGEFLSDMVEGELVVRGFGLMQGYYKKEREETFDADGWLHTGDRVFIADNRAYFVGRYYEMVKSQGANVSPREVESVIEEWPEIMHVFVFGTPHPTVEEEVTAVIAFMPGQRMTPDEIRERASKELSSFKVPTRIEIIDDESTIPWLGSGKPDKLRIRAGLLGEDPTG